MPIGLDFGLYPSLACLFGLATYYPAIVTAMAWYRELEEGEERVCGGGEDKAVSGGGRKEERMSGEGRGRTCEWWRKG